MRPDDATWRHRAEREHATAAADADEQLRDVALTLDLARRSYEAWQATNPDTSPGVALRYAYHTHEALHELSRVVNSLIETFRGEAAELLVTPPAASTSSRRTDDTEHRAPPGRACQYPGAGPRRRLTAAPTGPAGRGQLSQ